VPPFFLGEKVMEWRRRRGKWWVWRRLIGLLVAVVALTSWTQLISKPLMSYRQDHDLVRLLNDLAFTNKIYDSYGDGWAFLFLTLVVAVIMAVLFSRIVRGVNRYLDQSHVDLSILCTEIMIRMESDNHKSALITRNQVLHANNPDVWAYHYSHIPERGIVVRDSFSARTEINGQSITAKKEFRELSGRGIELIEMFDKPLPINFFCTYLPDKVVLYCFRHLGMFQKIVARRTVHFRSEGEYNWIEPIFQLQLLRYPAHEIRITLDFPPNTAPSEAEIAGLRIRENVAASVSFDYAPTGGRVQVTLVVRDADQERIRLRWKNKYSLLP
jgi:hypothetical protein